MTDLRRDAGRAQLNSKVSGADAKSVGCVVQDSVVDSLVSMRVIDAAGLGCPSSTNGFSEQVPLP